MALPRAARASALWRRFGLQPAVAYVDAAPYRHYTHSPRSCSQRKLPPTHYYGLRLHFHLCRGRRGCERVAPPAAGILRSGTTPSRPIYIIWDRASPPPPGMDTRGATRSSRTTTSHCTTASLPSLSPHCTNSFPSITNTYGANFSPARLALFHPGTYSPACRLCGSSNANYDHILFSCPASWQLRRPQQWGGCFV
ncbi:hypothetical protein HPB52_010204 [Rhipicephalus sanguineus]|uniref:Uncharacterized protein n=1 Tax=Rhipicephalus sanguineus TaxID=34632 RepID=A0A9D4Q6R7_RHISA|nr:hypothetical protein HPB52_010204 [Rhipicephalus sanguineus]